MTDVKLAEEDAGRRARRARGWPTMKHLTLCLCMWLGGCAGTTPQDVLDEFARSLASASALYHTQCDGREDEALCVEAREHYNRIIDLIDSINQKAAK